MGRVEFFSTVGSSYVDFFQISGLLNRFSSLRQGSYVGFRF